MSNSRVWLFRGLVSIAASLLVASFAMPWWTCKLEGVASTFTLGATLRVYGYGIPPVLNIEPQVSMYLEVFITPFYQTVLAWVFIAIIAGLILLSIWLKGRKGRWLLGSLGLTYIAYATIALIWITNTTGDYGISLQGHSYIPHFQIGIDAYSSLRLGYYLAHTSGLMCIALALFSNRIIGKHNLNTLKDD